MAYTPNADDATQPLGTVDASTAAPEFRALKAKVNTLVPGASSNVLNSGVRQTVLQGLLSAAGIPGMAAIGAGLNVDLKATTLAVYMAFANGFSNAGARDFVEVLSADVASYWPVVASNTSFLNITRTGAAVLAAGSTLAPPQYGDTYDQTKQSVLQFAGAAGAVIFLDDFGNTWTAQGGAKVQTNYFKFGTGALGGAGATNALNGAADYIKTTNITTLGSGSWALRAWVKPLNALPGVGAVGNIIGAVNAAGFGVQFGIYNNAGTIKFSYFLSSTGAAADIANGVQGTTTPVLGTEYFVELTYDAFAGVYRLYVNGAQEASTASALKVCATTGMGMGATNLGGSFLQGYIDKPEFLPYCQHPAGTAYAVPVATPSIIAAGYSSDWFDTSQMLMKSVSVASAAVAANPTFTSSNKLYVGEADTSGAAVTAVRTYAYQGKYDSGYISPYPAAGTPTSKNHNLGVQPDTYFLEAKCMTTDLGLFSVGDVLRFWGTTNGADFEPQSVWVTKLTIGFTVTASRALFTGRKIDGASVNLTPASWAYRLIAQRGKF